MRTHIKHLSALTGAFIFALSSLYAQNKEYDDLYFTPDDRLKVKKVKADDRVVQNKNQVQQLTANPVENYSAKNVNPEFLARYQAPSDEYSDSEFTEGEYFNDDYNYDNNRNTFPNNADVAIRDRYGNTSYFRDFSDVYWSDPFYYQGSLFDPFYSPYRYGYNRYGYGHGYRPFRSGWSLSFGFGNTWGMRHGWHSGFSFGYGWGSGYYNPFYSPYYGSYYDPFYSSYYGYGSHYGYGYLYNSVVVINNYETRADRTVKRGPGTSRSSRVATSRRVPTSENNNIVETGRSSSNSRVSQSTGSYTSRETRDNLGAQSRYYRRSREAVVTQPDAATTSRTYDSRSRSTSNYSTESRTSTRSKTTYSRPSNNNSSSYSRSQSNSRTYSTPSRSRSSSYSTPSRSSRSSSYSTPSRSSSRSYSTGSSSRSSSSGTRSSSSSSRSRRGN